MARNPLPWYWPERGGWYTILNGQRQPLGPHPEDAPPPHKNKGKWIAPPAIMQAFHTLMAKQAEEPQPTPTPTPEPQGLLVAEVFDKFLSWTKQHKAPRTYEWYRDHIQDFINRKPEAARLPYDQLRP